MPEPVPTADTVLRNLAQQFSLLLETWPGTDAARAIPRLYVERWLAMTQTAVQLLDEPPPTS